MAKSHLYHVSYSIFNYDYTKFDAYVNTAERPKCIVYDRANVGAAKIFFKSGQSARHRWMMTPFSQPEMEPAMGVSHSQRRLSLSV